MASAPRLSAFFASLGLRMPFIINLPFQSDRKFLRKSQSAAPRGLFLSIFKSLSKFWGLGMPLAKRSKLHFGCMAQSKTCLKFGLNFAEKLCLSSLGLRPNSGTSTVNINVL